MIDIAKVRLLEERVRAVIARLGELKTENARLQTELVEKTRQNEELSNQIAAFTQSQAEIEGGIINALRQLDEIEDSITEEAGALGAARVDLSEAIDETTVAANEPAASRTVVEQPVPASPPPAPVDTPSDSVPIADEDLELDIDPDDEDEEGGPELDIF